MIPAASTCEKIRYRQLLRIHYRKPKIAKSHADQEKRSGCQRAWLAGVDREVYRQAGIP